MVKHLGRLKIVTRRKEGQCRYKYCPKDRKLNPGDKVLILTKLGKIGTRTTIFYKAYHPDCFGLWALWMIDQTPISKDGRKSMELDSDAAKVRANLVRERARILRDIRTIESGDRLDRRIARLTEVDRLIGETGYPVLHYKGRKSAVLIEFEKFIQAVKDRYLSELRVPKKVFDQAKEMGMEGEFRDEMDIWHREEIVKVQKQAPHMEDTMTDQEDTNGQDQGK
ncbi:hypothetical protein LCGC14_0665050 [marine sediment metagenome]|uniref:Uncharacterized protein n=1 Tax=marine sediment metagenome TaxID=412755 RepID=A0A0F9TDX8_9ZZZZ